MSTVLRNARLVDWLPDLTLETADLRIEDGEIAARGAAITAKADDEVIDVGGALVMPGWVVGHHHLYSGLARGMPGSPESPTNFTEILQWVWWVLDRCLDPEANRLCGLIGGIDALLCGATFIVDHHASPNAIEGSLDTLAKALLGLGVRSCLAYEVSDRDGPEIRQAGIVENNRFTGIQDWSWPLPGGHACFTMSDEALAAFTAEGRIHIHLLEDACDRTLSEALYGADPVTRLDKHGLIGPGSLFAHGVHLTDDEFELLVSRGAFLAYNARSNANNGVGSRGLDRYRPIGVLGTDGMDSDLWSELKFAFFKACDVHAEDPWGALAEMLQNNFRLATRIADRQFGQLVPGAPADLMVVAYDPPTPVTSTNLMGHLVYGMHRGHVRHVMSDGVIRVRDWMMASDPLAGTDAAQRAAEQLWARMSKLWESEGKHPFPESEHTG